MTIKTPSVSLPKLPKLSLHTAVICLVSLALLGLLGYGIVRAQEQAEATATAQAALQETALKAENQRKADIAAKDAEITHVKAQRDQLCTYLNGLVQARATKGLVTVPGLACIKD